MAQFERSIVATPSVDHRRIRPSHVALVTIGLIVFIGAAYATALIASQATRPSALDSAPAVGEVTDGWLPAISAANRAAAQAATLEEARRTADGWSSALLKPEPVVVDGWSSALLKAEPVVVDGWMARYGGGGE